MISTPTQRPSHYSLRLITFQNHSALCSERCLLGGTHAENCKHWSYNHGRWAVHTPTLCSPCCTDCPFTTHTAYVTRGFLLITCVWWYRVVRKSLCTFSFINQVLCSCHCYYYFQFYNFAVWSLINIVNINKIHFILFQISIKGYVATQVSYIFSCRNIWCTGTFWSPVFRSSYSAGERLERNVANVNASEDTGVETRPEVLLPEGRDAMKKWSNPHKFIKKDLDDDDGLRLSACL